MSSQPKTLADGHSAGLTEWAVRQSRPEDLDTVRHLLGVAELPVEGVEDVFDSGFIVAEGAGRVIGSAGLETYGRYGLFRSLTVEPGWQRRRIGQALMENRMDLARSNDLIAVFLLTIEPGYFARFGFQPVNRDSVPPEIRNSPEFSSICPDTATVMVRPVNYSDDDMREQVKNKYAAIARTVKQTSRDEERDADKSDTKEDSCCESTCCGPSNTNAITANLYSSDELDRVPKQVSDISLGCGNPTALAELKEGEVVLDLGSGGGIDVLLSARRVGPTGKAYGLDMTDDMLDIARENQKKVGVENAEFLKGEIESIPLPDGSVDVILSNCVINLSTDKHRVLSEAFRVLRPGGRFAVSDIVTRGALPDSIRRDVELWAGCLAGSLEEQEYKTLLHDVGFESVEVETTRIYTDADLGLETTDLGADAKSPFEGKFISAFIRATKPRS